MSFPPGPRPVMNVIGLVLALAGAALAIGFADRSRSWDTTCYEVNICDSLTFTVVAELLNEGRTPYSEATRREHISRTRLHGESPPFDLPFQYSPNALPLFALRAVSSPRIVHAGLALLTTVACLLLFWQLLSRRITDQPAAVMLMLGVALSRVVAFNAELGQNGLLAAAIVLSIVLWWKSWPLASGVLLGVLAFKPQFAVPILLVATLHREWRIVIGSVTAFASMTVASGLWFGFDEWTAFLGAATQSNHTVPYMVSWMGLAYRLNPDAEALIQAAAVPVFFLAMVTLGVALWAGRDRFDLEGQLSLALAWMVLTSPNTHPYDLLVLAPALIYVSRGSWGVAIGPLFFLVTWLALPRPHRWVMVVGLIALASLSTFLLRRDAVLGRPPDAPGDTPQPRFLT